MENKLVSEYSNMVKLRMGIPAHIQDTLFYPMVSGRDNGTGLGLSISQTLIHQHQGKLSCKSRIGNTEFIILLPLSEENIK